jgi:hypothetical protein
VGVKKRLLMVKQVLVMVGLNNVLIKLKNIAREKREQINKKGFITCRVFRILIRYRIKIKR